MITVSRAFSSLSQIDLRMIGRDPLLRWIFVLPLLLALLMRFGLPWLGAVLQARFRFDLSPFYPLIVSNFLFIAPTVSGLVVGFLLLDERDEGLLLAYAVSPLPLPLYLAYRLALPIFLGLVVTLLCYPIIGLVSLPAEALFLLAIQGAFFAPYLTLYLAAFAQDKVSGMAMLKLNNGIMLLPVAAYFVPEPWQYLGGIIPAFWTLKAFWSASAGQAWGIDAAIGFIFNAAIVVVLLRLFLRKVHE